jgi:hypothetical protein
MPERLEATIILDYQNVHFVGHNLFEGARSLPKHRTLIDPSLFAQQLLIARNDSQRPGQPLATLRRVLVFRGLPAPEHNPKGYARNLAQRSHWQRDPRVDVSLRPLKYEYERDANGRPATDIRGRKIVVGQPREKGIDVQCALATVREAQDPDVGIVILASSDSDLSPAIDEVRRLGTAKIETFCWWDANAKRGFQIHPTDRGRPIWCTRMAKAAFVASRDTTSYE